MQRVSVTDTAVPATKVQSPLCGIWNGPCAVPVTDLGRQASAVSRSRRFSVCGYVVPPSTVASRAAGHHSRPPERPVTIHICKGNSEVISFDP